MTRRTWERLDYDRRYRYLEFERVLDRLREITERYPADGEKPR